MDPISAIGDERRRMVENTQRSNSALHSQSVKRHRDRMKRGGVNSSRYTSEAEEFDTDFMSGDEEEDLDYEGGGGDNAELFRQMWEDDVEANIPEPMAGDTIFDDSQSSGLLGYADAAGDVSAPWSNAYSENAYPEGECNAVSEWHENDVQEMASTASGSGISDGAEVGERSAGSLGVSARYTDKEIEEAASRHSQDGVAQSSDQVAPATDKIDNGNTQDAAEEPETNPDAPDMAHISMGETMAELFGGLDALFGIGDGVIPLENKSDLIQIISSPVSTDSLPRAELPPVSADIGEVLDGLIIGNTRSPHFERLRSMLSRFGKGVLSFCAARNIKVHLVPANQLSGADILRGVEHGNEVCGGLYTPSNHTCFIDEQALAEVPYGVNPVIFFMAQAWDHALGEDDFASLHSPAVLANFEACRINLEGHCFADELCACSPVYYFAQSVEAYLAENDCVSELWNREDLYDLDRSMYSYVEYLFKQGNR